MSLGQTTSAPSASSRGPLAYLEQSHSGQYQMPRLVDAYLQYMDGVPAEQEIGQEAFEIFYIDVFGESSVSGLRHSSYSMDYQT